MIKSRIISGFIVEAMICMILAPMAQGQGEAEKQGNFLAIDTHVHADVASPTIPIDQAPKVAATCQGPEKDTVTQLAQEMEEAHIGMVFLMGGLSIKGDPLGIKRSVRIAEALSALPNPKQGRIIAAADPSKGQDEEQMKAVRRQLDKHRAVIVAFKFYLGYHGPPMHPGYDAFYRLALEYNLPVIFHTGCPWTAKGRCLDAKPFLVDDVIIKYPNLQVVLAHAGIPFHHEATEMIFHHPENVWIDLSAMYLGPSEPLDEMVQSGRLRSIPGSTWVSALLEALTSANRYDRILYGSDWALCDMPAYRRFIEAIIPDEHHRKVFRENAEELFRVKLDASASESSGGN